MIKRWHNIALDRSKTAKNKKTNCERCISVSHFRLKIGICFLAVKESLDQHLRLKSQLNEQACGYKAARQVS